MIQEVNFALIDRATRLINQIPPQYTSSPASFAKAVICRPYASEIQRLRAIFVFLSEKFAWEPLHASDIVECEPTPSSLTKIFETKRGTAEDLAWCFLEMCQGCCIHAEVIAGYLKGTTCFREILTLSQRRLMTSTLISSPRKTISGTRVGCSLGLD